LVRTPLKEGFFSETPVEWAVSTDYVPYDAAVEAMETRVAAIRAGQAHELIWLLEHPSLYTGGTSADVADLRDPQFPVFKSARGGQYTYHGPGQRVAYAMLDLGSRKRDVRGFVAALEEWIITTLEAFNVIGERREDRVGVWVDRSQPAGPIREDKIAAIGVRLRHWISFHGISVNVEPNLAHFGGIVPCGIADGLPVTLADTDAALKNAFETLFGKTIAAQPPI